MFNEPIVLPTDEEGTAVTPQLEPEVNGNGMPTPHSYGTPHTTTNKLVGNTFFGPDFNLDTYRGMLLFIYFF